MIHQYKLGDYNIVLDVCSGSVHAVDEVAYDIIAMYENNSRETVVAEIAAKYADREDITEADVEECYQQVTALKDMGKLFAPDTFESMAGHLKAKTSGVVKALCLHITHTCNLNCVCEFCDPDFAVFMFTPEISKEQLEYFVKTVCDIPKRESINENPPAQHIPCRAMSVRDAAFSASEEVDVDNAVGRVLSAASVGCPSAVPIVMCGEIIDIQATETFKYYGIEKCCVIK